MTLDYASLLKIVRFNLANLALASKRLVFLNSIAKVRGDFITL